MAFRNAQNVDIRDTSFVDVGGNQYNVTTLNYIGPYHVERASRVPVSPFLSSPAELAQAIADVQEIGSAIRRRQQSDEQLERVLVAAFAMHPCLDHIQPNLRDNAAWAQQIIRKRSGLSNRLKSLLKYFSRDYVLQPTHSRGSFGTRARITLLLCWLIGHKLSKEQRLILVSTAIQAGLKNLAEVAQENDGKGSVLGLMSQLDALTSFVERIAIQFGTSVPANEAGLSDLWGSLESNNKEDTYRYARTFWARQELPPERLIDFDLRKAPHTLLEALPLPTSGIPFILMPTTKLDEAIITVCAHAFGLGNKATNKQEVSASAFWNADPPPEPPQPSTFLSPARSQTSPLHYYSQSQLQSFVCRSNCQEPCHLTCDEFCTAPCTKQNIRWTHNRLLRTIILNWYCMQDAFLETSEDIPSTAMDLSATGLALPSSDWVVEAISVAEWIRRDLSDAADRVGWYLIRLVADEFTPAAVVALQGLCSQNSSTMWAICLLAELHPVFQDNPSKRYHQMMSSNSFTSLPTSRWAASHDQRRTVVIRDCTCGGCAEVIRTLEAAAAKHAVASMEQFDVAVTLTMGTSRAPCGAGKKYWQAFHERGAKFFEDLLKLVVTDGYPTFTTANVLTATSVLGIDLTTPADKLSVEQRAKIILCSHTTTLPNQLQHKDSPLTQQLGYLWMNFLVTYGPWLPRLASSPDDTRCFILEFNPPFINFPIPTQRPESFDTFYMTVYMKKFLPGPTAPPPQPTNNIFDVDDSTASPPDEDLLIHLSSDADGATTLTGQLGGLSIETTWAPFVCRGVSCPDVDDHLHTTRPVWTFDEFIHLSYLEYDRIYIVACTIDSGLHDDAAGLITIFASKFNKRVYLRDRAQCVECALAHMGAHNCSILCV